MFEDNHEAVSETTEENETLSPDKQNARPPQADTGNSVKENGRGAPDAVEADEDASGLKTPPRRVFGIRCFVANLALLYFFQFAMIVYLFGVIRTMERRFGLDSRKSGVILSADDVVQICVVTFIGHFGKRASKPRIIGVLALSFAVGGTMLAMPYFLYGAQVQGATSARNFTYGGKPADPEMQLCGAETVHGADHCERTAAATQTANGVAYGLFIVGQMFVGLGYSATGVLGLSYIDENAPKDKSSMYIGVYSGIISIGSIFGHLLAGKCTELPEDPFAATTLKQGDPTWIGSWWLGYVICSVIVTLFAIPIFFFPKSLSDRKKAVVMETDDAGLLEQLKEFPKSFRSLFRNAPYMVRQVSNVLMVFFIIGVFANVPRYLEIHFHLPASLANKLAAVPSVASVVGAVAGGALMSRLRLTPPRAAKLLVVSIFIVLLGAGAALVMGCPQVDVAGTWNTDHTSLSVATSCNANCSCSTQKRFYTPVCGSDDVSYFSPCHAGCQLNDNGTFSACGCIADGRASSGFCSETCRLLIPYIVVLLTIYFVGSLSRVPSTIVMFRIVKKDERPFALAFQSFSVNLLGFIPAPVFIGALIDSTCILWDEPCGRRGACLLYDIASFRHLTYGVGLGVLVLVLACKVTLWYLIRDIKFDDGDVGQIMPMDVTVDVDKESAKDNDVASSGKTSDTFEAVDI